MIIASTLLSFVAIGAYFFFVKDLSHDGKDGIVCTDVHVTIKDSLDNGFIKPDEVKELIGTDILGLKLDSVNTYDIEQSLVGKNVIATANAYVTYNGKLVVEVTQRKPVVRIQTESFGCFSDETGFILPLNTRHPLNLPVVTGNLPIEIDENFRGYTDNPQWMNNLIHITEYIRNNAYWCDEIEQICVESNGDLVFYPKARDFKILFGGLDNMDRKFSKLVAFYKTILKDESKKYTIINLRYKDQIICK